MNKNVVIWIGIIVGVFAAFLIWIFVQSSKPLPGVKIADLGRKHVPIGEKVEYNSNPPTSGPHYGDWIRAGVYENPRDDRNLVHSLEHGYVIMHYKCKSEEATEGGEASPSGRIDTQKDCGQRKNQLEETYNKKGKRKLIVTPRSNLDTNFALTAWNYLDKLDSFDAKRIEAFIDTYRDNGPERTIE